MREVASQEHAAAPVVTFINAGSGSSGAGHRSSQRRSPRKAEFTDYVVLGEIDLSDIRLKSSEVEQGITTTKTTMKSMMMGATSSSTLSEPQSSQYQGEAEPASDEEGSNFFVYQVCQVQAPVTRHCKRRRSNSVAHLGDAASPPPLAQVEDASMVTARMSILSEIDRHEGFKRRREESPTKTTIRRSGIINSAPMQTDLESALTLQYMEHLAGGNGGITIRELFASFTARTAFPGVWNDQVRSYLKNNPLIDEMMVEYLQCHDQLDVQQPPERSLAKSTGSNRNMSVTSGRHVPSPTTTCDPADPQPDEGRPGVRTRSKAHKNLSPIEPVQTKSVEKMQQRLTGNLQIMVNSASNDVTAADPTDLQQATQAWKDSSDDEAQLDDRGKPFLGSLQARQAKILAETGSFQKGLRCARRDIGKNWRCPLLAMAGNTLCEHHKAKSRAKYARQKLQKRSRSPSRKIPELETGRSMKLIDVMQPASSVIVRPQPMLEDHAATTQVEEEAKTVQAVVNVQVDRSVPMSLKAMHAKICAEKGNESGVRCGRKDRGKGDPRKYWQCPMNAMKGRALCDHHYFQKEENKAAQKRRKAAAKCQGNISDFKNANTNDVGLSRSHTQFDQVPAEVPELSLPLKPSIDTPSQAVLDEKLDHSVAPDTADEIAKDDHADSDADQLLPHMLKDASRKRWYVAPRKTAGHANVDHAVKVNSHDQETSSGLILSAMIPPQPAMIGNGRKAQLFRSLLKSL